jgi:DNA topoisomerase I
MAMPQHTIHKGIHYVSDKKLSWKRKKHGLGFTYLDKNDKTLTDQEIKRIKDLSIPPAWVDVQICPDEKGHIQAIGFDEKGRKQYIYHPQWVLYNQQHKFDTMIQFGEVLPNLREEVSAGMRQHSLTKERILATIVWLLEHTFIRIGNEVYAKDNHSYGLTTLREKHVDVEGNKVKFSFKGKSGVYHHHDVLHPRIAQTIQQCIELPGYKLFNYFDEDDQVHVIDSSDVNEYLHRITGESLSAKDFRTWGGTVLAGDYLSHIGNESETVSNQDAFSRTVEEVSEHLGNTAAVCRKYYIHPKIFSSYEKKKLVPHFEEIFKTYKQKTGKLSPSERAAWTLIQK